MGLSDQMRVFTVNNFCVCIETDHLPFHRAPLWGMPLGSLPKNWRKVLMLAGGGGGPVLLSIWLALQFRLKREREF